MVALLAQHVNKARESQVATVITAPWLVILVVLFNVKSHIQYSITQTAQKAESYVYDMMFILVLRESPL